VGWDDIRDLARIRRSRSDRKVAGVAGGLGRHLDIDPVILRVAFVVLTFFGGVGLLLYVALWLLLPEDGHDWAKVKLDRRSRTVALVMVGVLALLLLVSNGWWGNGGFFLVCLVVVAVAAVIATQLPNRGQPPHVTYGESPGTDQATEPAETTATYPAAAYPPPSYAVPEQPRPVNPRKKGPILFWFALASMAVAMGALGIADLAGADVAASAYPATVLGLCAGFQLIGAFFGRAGGIILVGLVAYAVTAGVTIADRWDLERTVARPTNAAEVQDSYRMDSGELVVDLGRLSPADLDGREIHVSGDIGHLDIRVPQGINVDARLDIDGPGGMSAFGDDEGGFGHEMDTYHYAGPDAPTMTIDAQLDIGGIDLHTEESR
jgi:phage shock protein PspC (stress-responsive transcriptional regulator)